MTSLKFISKNIQQTQKLGELLGELAQPKDIYFLVGTLGSGKTALTQGIAKGLKISTPVISPTFMLVREYFGRLPLYHIDLYRLDKIEEILNLGLEQYLDDEGLCVIEWAEKGQSILPRENLCINMNYISKNKRDFLITPRGKRYSQLIKGLSSRLRAWN